MKAGLREIVGPLCFEISELFGTDLRTDAARGTRKSDAILE